jgi:peptidoglycan hydrolase-like protein with peptidoglycan-binding domain
VDSLPGPDCARSGIASARVMTTDDRAYEPLTNDDLDLLVHRRCSPADPNARAIVRIGRLQRRLRALGLFCGTVDGHYGPWTDSALRRAQYDGYIGALDLETYTIVAAARARYAFL